MHFWSTIRWFFTDTLVGQVTFCYLYFWALWRLGDIGRQQEDIRLRHEGREKQR